MRIINLAHGSFYLVGRLYRAYHHPGDGKFLARPSDCAAGGRCSLSAAVHRLLLQRVQNNELAQVLLTFGFLLIISDLTIWIWGGLPRTLPRPEFLEGAVRFGSLVFPSYRIGAHRWPASLLAILIWLLFERTQIGAIVRAGVDDEEMVRGIGISIGTVFTTVFAVRCDAGGGRWRSRWCAARCLSRSRFRCGVAGTLRWW